MVAVGSEVCTADYELGEKEEEAMYRSCSNRSRRSKKRETLEAATGHKMVDDGDRILELTVRSFFNSYC